MFAAQQEVDASSGWAQPGRAQMLLTDGGEFVIQKYSLVSLVKDWYARRRRCPHPMLQRSASRAKLSLNESYSTVGHNLVVGTMSVPR